MDKEHLKIGQKVYFKYKKSLYEGTVMDFEQEYSDKYQMMVSNIYGKVKISAGIIDNGLLKHINVWRKQSNIRDKKFKIYDCIGYNGVCI